MPADPRPDFTRLYRATLAPLRRTLARMLGDHGDAQDVAHDAFSRVYRAMDRQDIAKPEAFLFTTARRLALKRLRRRQISPVLPAGDNVVELAPSGAPGIERVVMARQEWARLEAAIAALPAGCRAVLRLCKFDGLSHAEIGARLGIAVSTVEKQHARALRLLRVALHDDVAAPSAGDAGEDESATGS